MMRNTLFKGKRPDNNEWIEGDLRHWVNGVVAIVELHPTRRDSVCGFEVIPSTVGQYINKCDKADKKVFVGDILKNKDGLIYIIQETAAGWGMYKIEGNRTQKSLHFVEKMFIIGNINDKGDLK